MSCRLATRGRTAFHCGLQSWSSRVCGWMNASKKFVTHCQKQNKQIAQRARNAAGHGVLFLSAFRFGLRWLLLLPCVETFPLPFQFKNMLWSFHWKRIVAVYSRSIFSPPRGWCENICWIIAHCLCGSLLKWSTSVWRRDRDVNHLNPGKCTGARLTASSLACWT